MIIGDPVNSVLNDNTPGVGLDPRRPAPVKSDPVSPYYKDPTANLVDLAEMLKLPPKACSPKWTVLECDCGRKVVKTGCMRTDCISCYEQVKNRRGRSIFERFHLPFRGEKGYNHNPTVCYTVFTLPNDIRYSYVDGYLWHQKVRDLWHLLRNKYGAVYGLGVSHPIGDLKKKDGKIIPGQQVKFHPHANFLWMAKVKGKEFLNVDQLRKDAGAIFGVPEIQCHHEYSDSKHEVLQWCVYAARPFPAYAQWQGSIRWFGQYPKKPRKIIWCCPDCGMPIKAIGTIAPYMIKDYNEEGALSGREPPWMFEDNIDRFKRKQIIKV